MSTKKVYQNLAHDRKAGLPDLSMSWTRTAKSAATAKREKEELNIRVAWDWRKRYSKTLTYSEVTAILEDWASHEGLIQFSAHVQGVVRSSMSEFVSDVDEAYGSKEEKIEANREKRRERKAKAKEQAKVKGKEAMKNIRKSVKG